MEIIELENEFQSAIKKSIYEWCKENDISIPIKNYGKNINSFFKQLIENLLQVNKQSVEYIFHQKYGQDLVIFFVSNYRKDKVQLFIGFIIHLIYESGDFRLFKHIVNVNGGQFSGNWAEINIVTGSESLSSIIERRILYLEEVTSSEYETLYYHYYTNNITQNRAIEPKGKSKKVRATEDQEKVKKLKYILAASGIGTAGYLGGKLIRTGKILSKIKIWINNHIDISQAMLSLGASAGSIKLYGFCMEKSKPAPKSISNYKPYSESEILDYHLYDICQRSKAFQDLFYYLLESENIRLINIVESDEGKEVFWNTLQKIFWLMTQAYFDRNNYDFDIFLNGFGKDYCPIDYDNSEITESNINFAYSYGNYSDLYNDYKREILRECLNYMVVNELNVHPHNHNLFVTLIEEFKK